MPSNPDNPRLPDYCRLPPQAEALFLRDKAKLDPLLIETLLSDSREGYRHTEIYNPELGSLVLAYFGERLDRVEWPKRVIEHVRSMGNYSDSLSDVEQLIESSGAKTTYWSRSIVSPHEIPSYFVAIGKRTGSKALEAGNYDPKEIGYLTLTTSEPITPTLAHLVADQFDLNPETKINMLSAACASSFHAFNQIIEQDSQNPSGKLAMIIGIEAMSVFRHYWNEQYPGISTIAPFCFFSDGAFAFVFDPSRFRRLEYLYYEKRPDLRGVLETKPFIEIPQTDHILTPLEPWGQFIHQRPPSNQDIFYMDPNTTTRSFITFLDEMARLYKQKDNSDQTQMAKRVLCHRPSRLLYEKKGGKILKKEFGLSPQLLQWEHENVPLAANSPVVTFGHEWARIYNQLEPGDTILLIFYGAGINGGIALYQFQ
jgi:3-oxoacyl-[acyl-carrier-protein] synthase III